MNEELKVDIGLSAEKIHKDIKKKTKKTEREDADIKILNSTMN